MIPTCEKCSIDKAYTGIELYGAAQFWDSASYLRCDSCEYGRFV